MVPFLILSAIASAFVALVVSLIRHRNATLLALLVGALLILAILGTLFVSLFGFLVLVGSTPFKWWPVLVGVATLWAWIGLGSVLSAVPQGR